MESALKLASCHRLTAAWATDTAEFQGYFGALMRKRSPAIVRKNLIRIWRASHTDLSSGLWRPAIRAAPSAIAPTKYCENNARV